jgi:hypothetical protein
VRWRELAIFSVTRASPIKHSKYGLHFSATNRLYSCELFVMRLQEHGFRPLVSIASVIIGFLSLLSRLLFLY